MISRNQLLSTTVLRGILLPSLLVLAFYLCLPGVFDRDLVRATKGTGPESLAQRASEQAAPSSQGGMGRTKIAEGEYAIYEQANSGAYGPFEEEVYDFHETWTLWRVPKGRYEVEGERRFESPRDILHADRFLVQLSRDLTVIRLTEFARLRWRRDSGPLTCEFLLNELHCSSGAADPKQLIELRIPMERPFGLLWPISAFSLSGLTREAERDRSHGTRIQLISIEQPSPEDPVKPMVLDGELLYLGEEKLEAANQEWSAFKFSFKVPLHPQFLIWTSSKGLLLALAVEHSHKNWPEEGMKLMRLRRWADF